jgi:hypothetical protein
MSTHSALFGYLISQRSYVTLEPEARGRASLSTYAREQPLTYLLTYSLAHSLTYYLLTHTHSIYFVY